MAKLKNINTIQKMLDGTSKWHTRKSIGFSDIDSVKEKNKTREEGEIWEERISEHSVAYWRMENGIKVKYNVHPSIADKLREVRVELTKFHNCPKETCTCVSPTPLDEKLRIKTGMCEECLISFETKLKIQGKFNEYALSKMKNNAEFFFKQADKDVSEIKKELKSEISFVDENGDVEKWAVNNKEKMLERIDTEYEEFKKKILSKFEDGGR